MDSDYDYTHEQIQEKYGTAFSVSETFNNSELGNYTRKQIELMAYEYFTDKYNINDCEVFTKPEKNNKLTIIINGFCDDHIYICDFVSDILN